MATASTDTMGPTYPFGMLVTFAGLVLVAVAWCGGRLPGLVGPVLAAGWFIGATPLIGSVGLLLFGVGCVVAWSSLTHFATGHRSLAKVMGGGPLNRLHPSGRAGGGVTQVLIAAIRPFDRL